jgi:putative oxidoreductase
MLTSRVRAPAQGGAAATPDGGSSMDLLQILLIAGRVLLGGLFVIGGIHHFFTLPGITSAMEARGVPAARLVLIVGSLFQIAAGLLLMLGLRAGWAALGLVLFTVIATIMFLNFWALQGPPRDAARTGFLSNMAIVGGLLIAAAQAGLR